MKANFLPHLAARVFGVPLAIHPQKLSVILEAIGPRIGLREPVVLEGMPVVMSMPLDDDGDDD